MNPGAEKCVDLMESKGIIKDIQEAADRHGLHTAILAVGNVRPSIPIPIVLSI